MNTMKYQRGFTLIELLIVMVLIAALFSAVSISTGTNNSKRDLIEEGQRLQALFAEASQQAVLYNQEVGWYFTEEEYGFLAYDYDSNAWTGLSNIMFRSRPINFTIELSELDGIPITEQLSDLYKDPQSSSDRDEVIPSIVFLSNSESSMFELSLYEDDDVDWKVILKSDGFGTPDLELPYDEEEQ